MTDVSIETLTAKLAAAEKEIMRLRELAFNIAKAAVPEWKKEFERAIRLEEKLSALRDTPRSDAVDKAAREGAR